MAEPHPSFFSSVFFVREREEECVELSIHPTHQLLINRSTNYQSIDQLTINRSIHQSINQSMDRSSLALQTAREWFMFWSARQQQQPSSSSSSSNIPPLSSSNIPPLSSPPLLILRLKPTDELINLIRERHWDAVRQRLVTHPSDARYGVATTTSTITTTTTTKTTTPLHQALVHRAPHDIILTLVDAVPSAVWTPDAQGWTPLHHVLLYPPSTSTSTSTTSIATTLWLIRRGGHRAASLHTSSSCGSSSSSSSSSSSGAMIGAPLHVACRHFASRPILHALLAMAPEQVTRPNAAGQTPATLLWKAAMKQLERSSSSSSLFSSSEHSNHHHHHNHQHNHTLLQTLLDILSLMMLAAEGRLAEDPFMPADQPPQEQPSSSSSSSSSSSPPCLHKVLAFQHAHAPDTDYVRLVLQLYPDSARYPCRVPHCCNSNNNKSNNNNNNHPNLPLHTAAALSYQPSPVAHLPPSLRKHLPSHLHIQDPMLQVLQAYPPAAARPNHQGRLPLVIALSQGKRGSWVLQSNHRHGPCPPTPNHHHQDGGIQQLLLAYPDSVMRRDPLTALYPLQVAAEAAALVRSPPPLPSPSPSLPSRQDPHNPTQDEQHHSSAMLVTWDAQAESTLFHLARAWPHQIMVAAAATSSSDAIRTTTMSISYAHPTGRSTKPTW